jgi:hypothetical protein
MTEIKAITRLHYGADYLEQVIRSTEGFADKHIVVYTPVPTFGHYTHLPNPDTRDQLLDIAQRAAGKRLHWIEGRVPEIAVALDAYDNIDILLELDADEVIQPQLVRTILERYEAGLLTHRQYRLPMIHHWRSFSYACRNPGWPGRLYLPKVGGDSIEYFEGGEASGVIHHFGYCRRRADMEYKVQLSVHRPEWRAGWWENKYDAFPNDLADVHPCCVDMWNAEPYDKTQMPEIMRDHPYYNLEVVE